MNPKDIRIIFMGTPEFAMFSLKSLYQEGYNIVSVITMPDKPAGRGQKIIESPVKQFAVENNIPVLQPENLKSDEFISKLKNINPDLQIVVAFRMLPKQVWSMPRMGTINLHASLLPHYRGAAPINWSIINGEKITGVTTFFIEEQIDTGNIILQEKVIIEDSDSAGILHDKLMTAGANLIVKTIETISDGKLVAKPQSEFIPIEGNLKIAPKIFKDTCKIDWTKNAENIYNFIRGLSPYPAAWTELCDNNGNKLSLKIFDSTIDKSSINQKAGEIISDYKKYLKIACADYSVIINELQASGKKRMKTDEFLRGFNMREYHIC
jgi:methionyl-tRNA formyltransferase